MRRPSVFQILRLAAAARRSPDARRVLFDALIERYGDDLLAYLASAQGVVHATGTPRTIFLDASELARNDIGDPSVIWNAVCSYPTRPRRGRWYRDRATEQLLVVLRPRPAS